MLSRLSIHPQKMIIWYVIYQFFWKWWRYRLTADGYRFRFMLTVFLARIVQLRLKCGCGGSTGWRHLSTRRWNNNIVFRSCHFSFWPPRSCDLTCVDYKLYNVHQQCSLNNLSIFLSFITNTVAKPKSTKTYYHSSIHFLLEHKFVFISAINALIIKRIVFIIGNDE